MVRRDHWSNQIIFVWADAAKHAPHRGDARLAARRLQRAIIAVDETHRPAAKSLRRSIDVIDVSYGLLIVGFFVLAAVYAYGCGRL
jgi:hypothetical protein